MRLAAKKYFLITLALAAVAFFLFLRPNAAGSENFAMVAMFEPDEASPLPYVLKMVAPADSLEKALRAFIFYGYYYYGFPYFALSALSILPLQLLGRINDMPVVMMALRQGTSVLPMLAGLLLLVYLQDGFRTYRSPLLFLLLFSVPAVVTNNFWWHPDSLTVLLAVGVLFFLVRDNLRFGWNFLAAAAVTGLLTATKLIGLYFFLAVGLTLLWGWIEKKAPLKRLAVMSAAFLAVMAAAFLVGNPFLVSGWARLEYRYILNKEAVLLTEGYSVVYEKGLAAAWPVMREMYGEALFLIAALGAAIWGAWKGPNRRLFALILAWFLPLTVSLLVVTHFKFQYWLPVALPLLSCLVIVFPERTAWREWFDARPRYTSALRLLLPALVLAQAALFVSFDAQRYSLKVHRAENNPRIEFYERARGVVQPLEDAVEPLHVYHDYRMYLPDTPGWKAETNYELLEYGYIKKLDFDVLLLLEQRIRDYLNEGVQGVNPKTFALNQQFYRDADTDQIEGYHLVYRDAVGLIYVRDNLWHTYYGASK